MEKALKLAFAAVLLRLLVAPLFAHLWDVKVLQETAYYTLKGINIYSLVYTMSREAAEAAGQPIFYEGYAYPPYLILVILPFYMIYLALGGDPQPIKISEAITGASLIYELQFHLSKDVFLFLVIIKTPTIIADAAIVYILGKRDIRIAEIYALSPYALFITGIWGMFDSLVALSLILSVILLERGRYVLSGLFYGLSLIKIYPILAFPAFLLGMRRKGVDAILLYLLGVVISQIPTIVYIILDPIAFLYTVLVFHVFRQPSGLTPLRMLNMAENITLSTTVSTVHSLISVFVYLALVAFIYKRSIDVERGVALTLSFFLAFSKVVHEQYYLSVYPILLRLVRREARLLEAVFLLYSLVNVGLFIIAPTLLFLVDYRFLELHTSLVYGDLGYIATSFAGPLLLSIISIITFITIVKTIMKLLN